MRKAKYRKLPKFERIRRLKKTISKMQKVKGYEKIIEIYKKQLRALIKQKKNEK